MMNATLKAKWLAASAIGLCAHVLFGMTGSELLEAINAVEAGGTVYVTSDVTVSETMPVNKRFVLASAGDERYVISAQHSSLAFTFASGGDLTLTNVVVDGCKGANKVHGVVDMSSETTMTLACGAVVRNFNKAGAQGTFIVRSGAHLVMKDGAEIRACENARYGSGVLIGYTSSDTGVFDMEGGLITECHGKYGSKVTDYDGAVYIYGGTFNMSGGSITGNLSDNSIAGVCAYGGKWNVSGSASVTNNQGGTANDITRSSTVITFGEDFCGHMTYYTPSRPGDASYVSSDGTVCKSAVGRRPNMGGIVNQLYPEMVMDGYTYVTNLLTWGTAKFLHDDRLVASTSELSAVLCATDTLEVVSDINWTVGRWRLPVQARDILLRSTVGNRYRIRRASQQWDGILGVTNALTKLRIENVIIDGNVAITNDAALLLVMEGRVELGQGAVLCNGRSTVMPSAVSVQGAHAIVSMEDGAVICDCQATGDNAYGTAVRIGTADKFDAPPAFVMSGGLVTNCQCNTSSTAASGYGGVVYVYNGSFEMTGGKIAGNTSVGSSAGVMKYAGQMRLGGTAVIENNVGAANDLYAYSDVTFFGDFRGRVGISNGSQDEGRSFNVSPEEGATGAWCFHAAGTGAGLIGRADESRPTAKIYWGEPVGWIGTEAYASVEDAGRGLTRTICADAEGRAALPLELRGVAAAAAATVTVAFDPDEFKASSVDSVVLLKAVDVAWSGERTFILPDSASSWKVSKRADSYVLHERAGTIVHIR